MILKENLLENRGENKMILIVITAMIGYIVFFAWTWQTLGSMEKKKKVVYILIGTIFLYGVTWLIFPKSEINSQKVEIQKQIQNTIVIIFTGINGIIFMPQMGKLFDKIKEGEIKKEQVKKRIILLMLLFILIAILERGYMKDTQAGILRVYQIHEINGVDK